MSGQSAIVVDDVAKRFRLFSERNQSIKATLLKGRRSRYEEFWALDGVSIEVPQGSTFGLIGENGSGKSTLLKCLAGILRPDRGDIHINGTMSALLELGAGFHPELSGRENVFLNGALLGLSRAELTRRFDDIVEFSGLERFIDNPVKTYSSGMYVRLGFSVAINVEPDVLLVDEVLAVGDESFQRRCFEKFRELRQAGRTIVVVTHALDTVRNLCDHAAWLEHGHLMATGPAATVVEEYLHQVRSEAAAEPPPPGTPEVGAGEHLHVDQEGSGEIQILGAEVFDGQGRPTSSVRTGDSVTFRLHFEAPEPILEPVFGLGFFRSDGAHVSGPNTRLTGVSTGTVDGRGHVDYHVDRLLMLPGTYDVTLAAYDSMVTHPYGVVHHGLRFSVDEGEPREHRGIVSLGGHFTVSTGSAMAADDVAPVPGPPR